MIVYVRKLITSFSFAAKISLKRLAMLMHWLTHCNILSLYFVNYCVQQVCSNTKNNWLAIIRLDRSCKQKVNTTCEWENECSLWDNKKCGPPFDYLCMFSIKSIIRLNNDINTQRKWFQSESNTSTWKLVFTGYQLHI